VLAHPKIQSRGKPPTSIETALRFRRDERGVTLLMVTVGILSLLAMAVLAMDVVSLYVAKDQAQSAADAAALAGAQALSTSGTTSAPSSVPLNSVCNGSSGTADSWAQAAAAQNSVAGALATVTTSCPSSPDTNPRIVVTVTRPQMPTFFARIWGAGTSTVGATAMAEAYNPSFDPLSPGGPAIQIQGVKPWLIFNCNTCTTLPNSPIYFTANYQVANGASFIGQSIKMTLIASTTTPGPPASGPPPPNGAEFYALDPPAPASCPSTSAVQCNQIGTGPPGVFYHDNIACMGSLKFGNNQSVPMPGLQVDTRTAGALQPRTIAGTECLIHAGGPGLNVGQDLFTTGLPVTITGGFLNPDPALRNVSGIHRSDSIVTVPVFNCPPLPAICNGTGALPLPIVGFLQLGIQDVTALGEIDAVILNAAGVNPASPGPPIAGAGASPIPVRLIQ
jgi:Flp pilus assembly protein TadG